MGKTIMISSHILPELQDLCNTVGIIEQGELIYAGPWADIVSPTMARPATNPRTRREREMGDMIRILEQRGGLGNG